MLKISFRDIFCRSMLNFPNAFFQGEIFRGRIFLWRKIFPRAGLYQGGGDFPRTIYVQTDDQFYAHSCSFAYPSEFICGPINVTSRAPASCVPEYLHIFRGEMLSALDSLTCSRTHQRFLYTQVAAGFAFFFCLLRIQTIAYLGRGGE